MIVIVSVLCVLVGILFLVYQKHNKITLYYAAWNLGKEQDNGLERQMIASYMKEHKNLYTYLEKSGYICVYKKTLEYKEKKETIVKGNIDAELVLNAMIEFPNYDKAIIVSGDGDFYPLIDYLKKKNKLLKIITPNKKYSSLLLAFLPYIVSMEA